MADTATTITSGLACNFWSHQIWSFPQILLNINKVILGENVDFTFDDFHPVTSILCSAWVWKLNKDRSLGCVTSATGCPEGILGPAPRCCERVKLCVGDMRRILTSAVHLVVSVWWWYLQKDEAAEATSRRQEEDAQDWKHWRPQRCLYQSLKTMMNVHF